MKKQERSSLTSTPRILYLGIDAPPGVFHYPVIRTERIDSPEVAAAYALWDRCTHALFTSKNGVRYWSKSLNGKTLIAIGEATAQEIRKRGGDSLVAPQPTQEGVIALLELLPLEGAFFLYPRSKLARPLLGKYLRDKGIGHYPFDLYDTVFQRPEPVPDLAVFEEIVFTSPSTVRGFFQIFPDVPRCIVLTPIGPVTKKALEEYFFARISSIAYNPNFQPGGF